MVREKVKYGVACAKALEHSILKHYSSIRTECRPTTLAQVKESVLYINHISSRDNGTKPYPSARLLKTKISESLVILLKSLSLSTQGCVVHISTLRACLYQQQQQQQQ